MIAIIPARGGSKGLPGKNIKELNGKPLIAYTIEAALNAKCVDDVFVSTDDEKIAQIAKEYGAKVPFMRPKELAEDTSLAKDVYLYTVERLRDEYGYDIKNFFVLLPTAPLRDATDIDSSFDLFKNSDAETLVSIKAAPCPPTWFMQKDENERLDNAGFGKGDIVTNRQNNQSYYIPNGAIYILNYELLKSKGTYYSINTVGFLMDDQKSVDIDYDIDFKLASIMIGEKG